MLIENWNSLLNLVDMLDFFLGSLYSISEKCFKNWLTSFYQIKQKLCFLSMLSICWNFKVEINKSENALAWMHPQIQIANAYPDRGSMALIKKFFRSFLIILLNFGCNKSFRIVAITWYSTYFENMTKGRRCGSAIQRSRSQPLDQPPKNSLTFINGWNMRHFAGLI